jgi:hypothetical protein
LKGIIYLDKKKDANKPVEFGIRMKLPLEDISLYYLAQRGSLLYEKLQGMSSSEISTFDEKVQKLFSAITNEIEQMINFSKHLPFILEEEEKIQWEFFNLEREFRIYYYLRQADGQIIADFDKRLDQITFKLWNSYHRYIETINEYDEIESQWYGKLEYVIIWTKSYRKKLQKDSYEGSNTGSTERKTEKIQNKFGTIVFLILYPILAAIYLIHGFKSYNWWDLAIGFTFLATTLIGINFKHLNHNLLIMCISLGISLFLHGGQFITGFPEYHIHGQILIVFGVIVVVGGSILDKRLR